jgi:hypothetical protein
VLAQQRHIAGLSDRIVGDLGHSIFIPNAAQKLA